MSCLCITISVVISIIVIIIVAGVPIFIKFRHHPKQSNPKLPEFNVTNADLTNLDFLDNLELFGSQLSSKLTSRSDDKSVFFSPYAIETCLAMTRMGSAGTTASEIDIAFNMTGKSLDSLADNYYNLLAKYEKSSVLNLANKVYIMKNHEVREDYNSTLHEKFFSSAENIDFSQNVIASSLMNSWVENKTEGAVRNFISADAINTDTRIFLLSAVHFKGEWANAFPVEATSEEDFYTNQYPNNTVKVQMMYKKELCYYNIFPELNATAVRLPYGDSDLSMLILLPNTVSGLAAMEQKLKYIKLEKITQEMQAQTSVRLYLPKFKTEFEIELKDVLMKVILHIRREFVHLLYRDEGVYHVHLL